MNILLIDHEADAVAALAQLCRQALPEHLEHLASAESPAAALPLLADTDFDVVLVDPDSQPGEPLESLVRRLGGAGRTILVSARADLAVPAFECGVLDFVPKPVTRERLAKALQRARALPGRPDAAEMFLAVRRSGRIDLVSLDDLIYVEGADKYSELVFTNGRRNFHDTALGRMEATLPHSFVRIHKSYLVRFAMVSRLLVLKGSRYFAELKNGQRLPVGRSHYERVKSRLLWPAQSRRP